MTKLKAIEKLKLFIDWFSPSRAVNDELTGYLKYFVETPEEDTTEEVEKPAVKTQLLFSYNLKRLKTKYGYSIRVIAFNLDESDTLISRWLSGASFPNAEKIDRLSDLFQVSPSEFFKEC